MSTFSRLAALRPSLSLVLAILTAYYYALLTKTVTTLKRLRTAVLDIIFWETWGLNGKVSKCIFQLIRIGRNSFCLDTNLLALSSQLTEVHYRSFDGYQALGRSP